MTTIVSCLYDIRKMENNTAPNNKNLDEYLRLSVSVLTGFRMPMVVFTDNEKIANHIWQTRREMTDQTRVVFLPFEETFFYADKDLLEERMKGFEVANWNRDKDTPLYAILNNNKFDFLRRATDFNFFNTEFFLWCDMGVQHCAQATPDEWDDASTKWTPLLQKYPDKIHQLRIHTILKQEGLPWKEYFRCIYHHVAGGLFGGHRDAIKHYNLLFLKQWRKMLDEEEWWQLDEAVMTIVAEENPSLFRFFHGDYDGIIANFITPRKSFFLIRQTMRRHIDAGCPDLVRQAIATWDKDSPIYHEVSSWL